MYLEAVHILGQCVEPHTVNDLLKRKLALKQPTMRGIFRSNIFRISRKWHSMIILILHKRINSVFLLFHAENRINFNWGSYIIASEYARYTLKSSESGMWILQWISHDHVTAFQIIYMYALILSDNIFIIIMRNFCWTW